MANLEFNVSANESSRHGASATTATLHWGDVVQTAAARARGPFDLVLGTDVVYVEAMVTPLLETIWQCATPPTTTVWLCGQIRDPDAHAALMREVPRWFEEVETKPLEGFAFAAELECFLLQLRRPRGKEQEDRAVEHAEAAAPASEVATEAEASDATASERRRRKKELKRAEKRSRSAADHQEAQEPEGGDGGSETERSKRHSKKKGKKGDT